jgi:hypothetical protein
MVSNADDEWIDIERATQTKLVADSNDLIRLVEISRSELDLACKHK